MNITLHCIPHTVISWEDFVQNYPEGSLALDGFINGPTQFDYETLHFNIDHHSGGVRSATLSTSAQVYDQIKTGFMNRFKDPGKIMHVYVNDCDEDVCLAYWLIKNYHRFEGIKSEPLISRFLYITDKLDIYGGAYPINLDDTIHRQRKWVESPYREMRMAGRLGKATAVEMANVIESVGNRLTKLSLGQGEELPLDTRYEIIKDFPEWKLIKEIGGDARYYLYSKGMQAFVSLLSEDNGIYRYSIGRISEAIPFPVLKIFETLNAKENIRDNDCWGGSSLIGGSPRKRGSTLSPLVLTECINETIHATATV